MTPAQFVTLAAQILSSVSKGWQRSPSELLDRWRSFVDDSISGYQWSWYDFDNERRVRGAIQLLLDDETLQSMPEFSWLAEQVEAVDLAYQEVLVALPRSAGNQDWWLAGVPRLAGGELARDLKDMFGLKVDVAS